VDQWRPNRAGCKAVLELLRSFGFVTANGGVSFLLISDDRATALATVTRIGVVRMSSVVDLVSFVSNG